MQWRRFVPWLALVAVLAPVAAQSPVGEALRRSLAYAQAMHPAGLASFGGFAATFAHLQRAPELQRAVALASLDQDSTLPYRLLGEFTLDGDVGGHRTGTVEADRYNDRWSHLTVSLGGLYSTVATLDGRRVADERIPVLPFSLDRLLRAAFDPLGDAVAGRGPFTTDTVQQDGLALHCTVLPRQPVPDVGLVPASRSVCLDPATGDLRLDVPGFGIRVVYRDVQVLGNRRIATDLRLLEGDRLLGELRFHVQVAGDLTPASYASLAELPRAREPRQCFHASPGQMSSDLETLDVHLVPKDDAALKRHVPLVVARVLADGEGRVADVELLGDTPPGLRERALRMLPRAVFRRREWKNEPVSEEGLLLLGAP